MEKDLTLATAEVERLTSLMLVLEKAKKEDEPNSQQQQLISIIRGLEKQLIEANQEINAIKNQKGG